MAAVFYEAVGLLVTLAVSLFQLISVQYSAFSIQRSVVEKHLFVPHLIAPHTGY